MAKSSNLWERRISIIATQHFIRQRDFGDTLTIAERLLNDEHDLIHKAVGWMLREVGKLDQAVEELFLEQHFRRMPRTMCCDYAIERFSAEKKRYFLLGVMSAKTNTIQKTTELYLVNYEYDKIDVEKSFQANGRPAILRSCLKNAIFARLKESRGSSRCPMKNGA